MQAGLLRTHPIDASSSTILKALEVAEQPRFLAREFRLRNPGYSVDLGR